MVHTLLRPFMIIGGIALLIAILLGSNDQAVQFAGDMSLLILDIARAIGTALLGGLFGGDAPAIDEGSTDAAATAFTALISA